MDGMFGKVERGEMSVEEMVTVVPTLQFIPEQKERRAAEKRSVEAETQDPQETKQ
jgi:hypothetical protein